MKKRSLWLYFLFGVYPISLFDLANSKLSSYLQFTILGIVASLLLAAASLFQVLNIISALVILLFVFTPYVIGKQMG